MVVLEAQAPVFYYTESTVLMVGRHASPGKNYLQNSILVFLGGHQHGAFTVAWITLTSPSRTELDAPLSHLEG